MKSKMRSMRFLERESALRSVDCYVLHLPRWYFANSVSGTFCKIFSDINHGASNEKGIFFLSFF